MGKTSIEDNLDGIEIISVGKLYTGSWDKKYWSSSRGKDRYPYPVGYKSLRTQNGITYTMEIVEGLKGPSFRIHSTDGKSCSGGTPDIAWESFQKKGSAKLWHAKRLSCKIDGVEFFGFKNPFVQRLLRELVANIGGTTEQSLLPSKVACETANQRQHKPPSPDPELLINLVKSSHVKGKRRRNAKVVSSKQLIGAHFEHHQQEECIENVTSLISKRGNQLNSSSSNLSTSAAPDEVSGVSSSPGPIGPENMGPMMNKERCLPIAERGLNSDSLEISDHLKVALCEEDQKLTGCINHSELDINNLQQKQEPGDKSKYEGQESSNIIPEEREGATNVQLDTSIFSDADLCAPDTLDHAGDISPASSQKKDVQVDYAVNDAIFNDVGKSEVLVTDSLPDDEVGTSAHYTNSEIYFSDSVGQEITKSMMTVLLPRAVPLLKTFSRKKKKSAKPSQTPTHRSQEENNVSSISLKDSTAAAGLAEHSGLEIKNENMFIPCADHDTAVSTAGNSDTVVPDSFENDGLPGLLPNADAEQAGQLSSGPFPHTQLPINADAEANSLLCHSGSSKNDDGTAAVAFVAATETRAPVSEFSTNSKRARFDCRFIDSLPSTSIMTSSTSESSMCRSSSEIFIPEAAKIDNRAHCDNLSSNLQKPSTSFCCSLTENVKMNCDARSNVQHKVKSKSKPHDLFQLFACYVHPTPISMVQLIVKHNEIFICVKCGYSENNEDTLFIHKASKNGEMIGCPSLIGHVPIALNNSINVLERDIAFEGSLLQLTPDGQSLVLLNSFRLPNCREGKLHCSCTACTSDSLEKNAVKIVRLNRGYVSLVMRLKTTQAVSCLLVCEPSFLLAAEEGGKLKLWVMNSGWSGPKEDWYLPTHDGMLPCIVELKTIPKSSDLVVGHNGFGGFGIWDIDKRNLISRFSSPGMSVLECIPVSAFRWQRKGEYKMKALVDEIMDSTKMSFSEGNENHAFSPLDKDVAVWLLISTKSEPDSPCYQSSEQEEATLGGCWRLALLINNTVITGSIVDQGAAATSGGHGIIGRCDGQVHVWELSTGKKLGNLHSFRGSKVSCVTSDASNSGALAIASHGQLQIYLPA